MGGYVASVEQWKSFSDEWQKALDQMFNGRPFKMSEANREWSESLQRERIGYLYDIIQRNVGLGVAITVDPVALDKVMMHVPDQRFRNPYFFCLHFVIVFLIVEGRARTYYLSGTASSRQHPPIYKRELLESRSFATIKTGSRFRRLT
jgi:hypothetical protein